MKRPLGGRAASRAATSASVSEAASVSMWAASESSASESASRPATTSATMNARISASAAPSRRRSASGDTAWWWCSWGWWAWVSKLIAMRRLAHHSGGDRGRPGGRGLRWGRKELRRRHRQRARERRAARQGRRRGGARDGATSRPSTGAACSRSPTRCSGGAGGRARRSDLHGRRQPPGVRRDRRPGQVRLRQVRGLRRAVARTRGPAARSPRPPTCW